MQLQNFIKSKTNLPSKGIENTIKLLNEDCTIPFISRYRKELTGNLDEVEIGEIVKNKSQFEELEKRKATILKALEKQEVFGSLVIPFDSLNPNKKFPLIIGVAGSLGWKSHHFPGRRTGHTSRCPVFTDEYWPLDIFNPNHSFLFQSLGISSDRIVVKRKRSRIVIRMKWLFFFNRRPGSYDTFVRC